MRYIRTKDGRIIDKEREVSYEKITHLDKDNYLGYWAGWYWYDEYTGYELECRDEDIIKQSDDIKELCDGYVIIPKNKDVIPFTRSIDCFEFIPEQQSLIEVIYGFIKTDKGLIYVAKMNEKGELCSI